MNILADSDLLVIRVVDDAPSGFPLTYSNFRMLFPETSFPELPETSFLVDFGYAKFQFVNRPAPQPFVNINDGPLVWDDALAAYCNSYVETPFTPEQMDAARQQQMDALRGQKNMLLAMCDWTQLPDVPLTDEKRAEWVTYRQQLRDYMDTVIDPFNPPAWPVPPQA
jgi:hypothetical protein